jgi:hypothetical protein
MGKRLPKCSSPSFARKVEEAVPAEIGEALQPLVRMTAALTDDIKVYDEKIEKLASEKYGHTALLRQVRSGADHGAGLRVDPGESETIREESGFGAVFGIGTEAKGLGGESAPIRNQQSRGPDDAPAAGGKRALYLGAIRT